MKVQLGLIVDNGSQAALQRLNLQPVPARLAHHLLKVTRAVGAEVDDFHATRIGLCKKYGTLPEGGLAYEFALDKRPAFDRELKDLLDTEVSLEFEPLKLEALGDVHISASDLSALSWLFVEV